MNEQPSLTVSAERRNAIAQSIVEEGAARVSDLAERFDVSTTTIRRDLETLESEGVVRRVHGGAVATEEAGAGQPEPIRDDTAAARIGQSVVEMIDDGETVFLGAGRIPLAVAQALTARAQVTVVTSSLAVAHWLAEQTSHTVIVTGGQVEGRDLGLVGRLTRKALASLRADRVILELSGVSAVEGLTHDSLPQAEIAQLLLETGSEVVVLVPPDRVGRVAAAYVGPVTAADVIVTARDAPSPYLWDLSETGVRITLA